MRKEIASRIALVWCIGLMLGIGGSVYPALLLGIIPLALLVVRPWPVGGALACCLAGYLLAPRDAGPESPMPSWFEGRLVVRTVPETSGDYARCEAAGEFGLLQLRWSGNPILSIGDEVLVQGPVEPPNRRSSFVVRHGFRGLLRADKGSIQVVREGPWLFRLGQQWKSGFLAFTASALVPRAKSVADALCFNARDGLSDPDLDNLRRSGTLHIVSTSGLHVLILAFAVQYGLGLLPIPRWAQLGLLCLLLLFYAGATGFRPPVVRAVVMAAILMHGYLLRREPDLLCALGVSAFGYLLWRPADLFDAGFQLSFIAVLGIALYMPRFDRPTKSGVNGLLLLRLKEFATVSLAATLFTAPIVAYHFGQVSVVSIVANVLIAAVLAPLILTALLAWCIAPLSLAVASGMLKILVEPLAGWILAVVTGMGSLSIAVVPVPEFSAYWLIPVYGCALMIWRRRAVRP